MGKSRGNRLCKQGAYFYWWGQNTMTGANVYGVDAAAFANVGDLSKKPSSVFGECYSLRWGTNANITKLPTNHLHVRDISQMFSGLSKLKVADFTYLQFDLPNSDYLSASSCFANCAQLVDIIRFPLYNKQRKNNFIVSGFQMFNGCTSLQSITFAKDGLLNVSSELDMSACSSLLEQSYLNIAYKLDPNSSNKTWYAESSSATTPSTKHVRMNQTNDGLEYCNAGDTGDLGTLSEYVTSKGWTLSLQ